MWYSSGQPSVYRLHDVMPPCEDTGEKPTITTLQNWVKDEWKERAAAMDEEVRRRMDARLVQDKVEMLNRHADEGKILQELALKVLTNKDGVSIKPALAEKMLMDGAKLERMSADIAAIITQMADKSDKELIDEFQKLIDKNPVQISIIEDENDEDVIDA